MVRQAAFYNCRSITYTYTEPTVFYEYMFDTAQIARIVLHGHHQSGVPQTVTFTFQSITVTPKPE